MLNIRETGLLFYITSNNPANKGFVVISKQNDSVEAIHRKLSNAIRGLK